MPALFCVIVWVLHGSFGDNGRLCIYCGNSATTQLTGGEKSSTTYVYNSWLFIASGNLVPDQNQDQKSVASYLKKYLLYELCNIKKKKRRVMYLAILAMQSLHLHEQ